MSFCGDSCFAGDAFGEAVRVCLTRLTFGGDFGDLDVELEALFCGDGGGLLVGLDFFDDLLELDAFVDALGRPLLTFLAGLSGTFFWEFVVSDDFLGDSVLLAGDAGGVLVLFTVDCGVFPGETLALSPTDDLPGVALLPLWDVFVTDFGDLDGEVGVLSCNFFEVLVPDGLPLVLMGLCLAGVTLPELDRLALFVAGPFFAAGDAGFLVARGAFDGEEPDFLAGDGVGVLTTRDGFSLPVLLFTGEGDGDCFLLLLVDVAGGVVLVFAAFFGLGVGVFFLPESAFLFC